VNLCEKIQLVRIVHCSRTH